MAIKLSRPTVKPGGVFAALGDANRRRILSLLRAGPRPAGAIGAGLPVGKATLSHHLKVLLAADLLRCERRGRQRVYALNTSVFEDFGRALAELFANPRDGRNPWNRIARAS